MDSGESQESQCSSASLHNSIYTRICDNSEDYTRLMKLSVKTQMPINQENGQRHYGPPPDWHGPPPTKGSEVFVSHLPRDCLEDELVPVFTRVGRIYLMRMMMDFSGMNRGFCFITFASPVMATQAINTLNNYQIREEHRLRVTRSMDNCRLYVGHIAGDIIKEQLSASITCLVQGVKDIVISRCGEDGKKSLCFCFIEFDCHRAAATARRLLSTSAQEIFGCDVRIDWAEPDVHNIDHRLIKQVTVVYIRNLPVNCKEESLLQVALLFCKGESIIKVKKIHDYAFIDCTDRESAERLLSGVHGFSLEGRVLEASWARHHIQGFSSKNKLKLENKGCMDGGNGSPGYVSRPPSKCESPSRSMYKAKTNFTPSFDTSTNLSRKNLSPPSGGSRIQEFFSFLNCSRDSQYTAVIAKQMKELIINTAYLNNRPSKAVEELANQLNWGLVKYYVCENKMHQPVIYFASVGIGDSEESMSYFTQHAGSTANEAVEVAARAFVQNLLNSTDLILAKHASNPPALNMASSQLSLPPTSYEPTRFSTSLFLPDPLPANCSSSFVAPPPTMYESVNVQVPLTSTRPYALHTGY